MLQKIWRSKDYKLWIEVVKKSQAWESFLLHVKSKHTACMWCNLPIFHPFSGSLTFAITFLGSDDGQNPNVHHHSWVDSLASISYLADGAVVEEEEGADKSAQSPGDDAGTKPPQNVAQLKHGVAVGHHHQGRVPSAQLEILHSRREPFSKEAQHYPSCSTSESCAGGRLAVPVIPLRLRTSTFLRRHSRSLLYALFQ